MSLGETTLPKKNHEAAESKQDDKVDTRATTSSDYKARLYALGRRGPLRDGMTVDQFMKEMRGDPDLDPGFNVHPRGTRR